MPRLLNFVIAHDSGQCVVGILVKATDSTLLIRLLDDRAFIVPRTHTEIRRGSYADMTAAIDQYQTDRTDNFRAPACPSRKFQIGDPKQRAR